jgi:hypothetical protein
MDDNGERGFRPPDKGAANISERGFLNPPAFGHPPCQGGKRSTQSASGGFLNPPAFGHPPCQGGLGATRKRRGGGSEIE